MTNQVRDLVFSGMALVIAIATGIMAFSYPLGSSYFPRTLAIIMGGLALLFASRTLRASGRVKLSPEGDVSAALTTFASIALYVLVMRVVGFEVATFAFLVSAMLYLGGSRHFLLILIVALVVTAGLHLVFFILLGVAAPDSLFL